MLTASLIGGLVILALIVVIVILWQRGNKAGQSSPEQAGVLTLLQNQLNELTRASGELTRRLEERMNEAAKTTHETLRTQASESNKIIRDIVQELTKVGEGQKQVMNFTEQLRSLQDILKNPKQRGVLGEYYLETLLKNVLPPGSYQMQYPFADGTIVDAG
jgi:DNA recombination protein RmuC